MQQHLQSKIENTDPSGRDFTSLPTVPLIISRFLLENPRIAAMVARHGQSHTRTFRHGGGGLRGTS
jgi:hypothetical protein